LSVTWKQKQLTCCLTPPPTAVLLAAGASIARVLALIGYPAGTAKKLSGFFRLPFLTSQDHHHHDLGSAPLPRIATVGHQRYTRLYDTIRCSNQRAACNRASPRLPVLSQTLFSPPLSSMPCGSCLSSFGSWAPLILPKPAFD
jgi:hypothetical protein